MKIYNYDASTKEFISESEAAESPLEPGVFLIPGNATDVSPIIELAGAARVFNLHAGQWEHTEDNRGIVVYDVIERTKEVITYLGPIKPGHTKLVPKQYDTWNGSAWVENVEEKTARDNAIRVAQIDGRLGQLDLKSVRPLRAKIANTATAEDDQILTDIETEIAALRLERSTISGV